MNKIEWGNIQIDLLTPSQSLDIILTTIKKKQKKIRFFNVNARMYALCFKDKKLEKIVQDAEYCVCESEGVRLGIALSGIKVPKKARILDLTYSLIDECAKDSHLKLYLLGGSQANLDIAINNLHSSHPTLNIVGSHNGFFLNEKEKRIQVAQEINKAAPDILMVCLGMPLQELWIDEVINHMPNVGVIIPMGANIDRLAGKIKDAPVLLANIGCEWLYRIYLEPQRMIPRYLHDLSIFFVIIVKEFFKKRIKRIKSFFN